MKRGIISSMRFCVGGDLSLISHTGTCGTYGGEERCIQGFSGET